MGLRETGQSMLQTPRYQYPSSRSVVEKDEDFPSKIERSRSKRSLHSRDIAPRKNTSDAVVAKADKDTVSKPQRKPRKRPIKRDSSSSEPPKEADGSVLKTSSARRKKVAPSKPNAKQNGGHSSGSHREPKVVSAKLAKTIQVFESDFEWTEAEVRAAKEKEAELEATKQRKLKATALAKEKRKAEAAERRRLARADTAAKQKKEDDQATAARESAAEAAAAAKRIAKLEKKLEEMNREKEQELREIQEETARMKREIKAAAKAEAKKTSKRSEIMPVKVEAQQELIQSIRENNAVIRSQNKSLNENLENLRVNGGRLSKNTNTESNVYRNLKYHHEQAQKKNAKFSKLEADNKKLVDAITERLDFQAECVRSEHYMKKVYDRTIRSMIQVAKSKDNEALNRVADGYLEVMNDLKSNWTVKSASLHLRQQSAVDCESDSDYDSDC